MMVYDKVQVKDGLSTKYLSFIYLHTPSVLAGVI